MIPILQRIDGWLTKNGKILFLILLMLGTYAGIRYHAYASNRFSEDAARITSLEDDNAGLNQQVKNLTEQLSLSENRASVVIITGNKLATWFDDMDKLFMENADSSSSIVEWMARNAQFYGDNISIGSQKYGAWQAQQTQAAKKYVEIKDGMSKFFDDIVSSTVPETMPPKT